ncbi:MAG: hypothetical protein B7Y32_02480 [Methylophilales bacterium 16-45-7]|nr:MAG: hypothetical protein B7Y32_02480 [Methylophilales bacterium 16-45-7]
MLLGMVMSNITYAEHVEIAETPLVNSGSSDVLPNIMFVLDNSGSMAFSYTPDWVDDLFTTNFSDFNGVNRLYRNPTYNTQFYNPEINYTPAVTHTGASMGNQASPWTAVKNDVTDTGAAKGGTVNLVGNANYYSFVAGEYCTASNLVNCIASSSPTATHQFAAPVRWCTTKANADAVTPAPDSCRLVREGSFVNLRSPLPYANITFSNGGGGTNSTFSAVRVNGI